jgi:hypothetical protein
MRKAQQDVLHQNEKESKMILMSQTECALQGTNIVLK